MIKGAIFDVDGTLLDSMEIWEDLATRYLATQGVTADESINQQLYTMSLEEAAVFIKQNYLPKLSEKEICDGFTGMLEGFYATEACAKEGARQMLEYLKDNGIKMAVATSGVKKYAEMALKREGLSEFFEGILTCTEVGEGKSSPLIYKKAAEIIKTEPSNTLVFEDAPHAVETAKAAGFITVGVFDRVSASAFEEVKKTADKAVLRLCDFRLF